MAGPSALVVPPGGQPAPVGDLGTFLAGLGVVATPEQSRPGGAGPNVEDAS